ncbi:MAG: hypothetical protein Ta2F_01890 [Termitinemataceae bacterium]|nr:MAG: hypothetical protein Ta2F_01890 [Termitinemataceae bacterium]
MRFVQTLRFVFFVLCFSIFSHTLSADDKENLLDNNNINSIFDEGKYNDEYDGTDNRSSSKKRIYNSLQDLITRAGFEIDASYSIMGGFLPGWEEAPWYFTQTSDWEKENTNIIGAIMNANIGLNIQPSRFLRIRQSISLGIPAPYLDIKEFYFDYNLKDKAFIKAGKYDFSWGYSPNYPYADLLARIPEGIDNPGEPYLAKIDIPIGIGGLQMILVTRSKYIMDRTKPKLNDFGGGAKYNIATRKFDIDFGFFSLFDYKIMPMRAFYSFKTTMFRSTEFYAEGMMSIQNLSYSASLGFIQDFFKNRLLINAEVYYNGEGNSDSMRRNSLLDDEKEAFPLLSGINFALNLRFKPGWFGNFQIFTSCLYSMYSNSFQIVPGMSIEPARHLELYFAVPMAPGSKGDNTYYRHNADWDNRPFSFVLAIKINGSYKYGHFE